VKVYFQTRQLLKKTYNKLEIPRLFAIILHEQNCAIAEQTRSPQQISPKPQIKPLATAFSIIIASASAT
jgi:hypothetical protein